MSQPVGGIVYASDPNVEHGNLLRAKSKTIREGIEFGLRLSRFKTTEEWREVTVIGPFRLWTEYLSQGLHISPRTAYRFMAASTLPLACSLQVGIAKAALLREIMNLTEIDETVEQAMEMLLPTERSNAEGILELGWRPFRELTEDEVAEAIALMKDGKAQPLLAGSPEALQLAGKVKSLADRPSEVEADQDEFRRATLEKAAREAVSGIIRPRQLKLRQDDGNLTVYLTAVPLTRLLEVATAIEKLPRT